MSGRSNHALGGFLFIAVCVLIAAVIYSASRGERSANSNASANQQASSSEAQLETLPDPVFNPPAIDSPREVRAEQDPDAEMGRCHSGSCSWSKTLSSKVVRSEQGHRLIELELLGGTSADGNGGPITWNRSSHRLWVFCSTTLPATIMRVDEGWQVDVLDFIGGIPGVYHSSAAIYETKCHPGVAEVTGSAESLGYQPIPADWQEVDIAEPNDMFAKAAEASGNP